MSDYIFKDIYSDSLTAIHGFKLKLILWNKTNKIQRFGQFLEGEFPKLVLPPYYYESNDSYEVFSYVCDLIESGFSEAIVQTS